MNNATSTFKGTLRLLAYSDIPHSATHVSLLSLLVLLPVLFLCYVTFCAIGPWFTPTRVGRLLLVLWHVLLGRTRGATPLRKRLADAFWDDQIQVELLEEPVFSWYLARPGLLLAALLMVALMMGLGGLGNDCHSLQSDYTGSLGNGFLIDHCTTHWVFHCAPWYFD
jgi:hypothetical protein